MPPSVTLESLDARITALEEEVKSNAESHGKIYSRLEAVETGHAVFDANLTNIWSVLKEIQADVKEMKDKPAKRYDKVIEIIIQWLIVGVLGAAIIFK